MIWPILYLLIGGVGAGGIVFLLAARRSLAKIGELQTNAALAQQRADDLSKQLEQEKSQTHELRESLARANANVAIGRAQLDAAQQNLSEQRRLLSEAQTQLGQAFASVSAEALAKNNEAFLSLARERFATVSAEAAGSLDQRKAQIEGLLMPMRELLDQYQIRVGEIEKSRVESYSMLREQLGMLAESQRSLNTQTSQLVTALSRPAVRGQWGEISLRRLVELAGLSQHVDFVEQQNLDGDQGRQRPDMVVNLPSNRDVVIDCKTSLDAFLAAAAATDPAVQRQHLQRHAQQVRARARELGAKSYWAQFQHSPEFVIMFLPGDPFLSSAVEQDPALIEDCLADHIIPATPTTLIALLRSIEFGWRQHDVHENAEQIKSLGKDLYDRIGVVLNHISKLGGSLMQAVSAYNQAVASMETRVMVSARKMSELGAKGEKPHEELKAIEATARPVSPALFDMET